MMEVFPFAGQQGRMVRLLPSQTRRRGQSCPALRARAALPLAVARQQAADVFLHRLLEGGLRHRLELWGRGARRVASGLVGMGSKIG
jgi:hypothetical protein